MGPPELSSILGHTEKVTLSHTAHGKDEMKGVKEAAGGFGSGPSSTLLSLPWEGPRDAGGLWLFLTR